MTDQTTDEATQDRRPSVSACSGGFCGDGAADEIVLPGIVFADEYRDALRAKGYPEGLIAEVTEPIPPAVFLSRQPKGLVVIENPEPRVMSKPGSYEVDAP